jgi:hypothetical protein
MVLPVTSSTGLTGGLTGAEEVAFFSALSAALRVAEGTEIEPRRMCERRQHKERVSRLYSGHILRINRRTPSLKELNLDTYMRYDTAHLEAHPLARKMSEVVVSTKPCHHRQVVTGLYFLHHRKLNYAVTSLSYSDTDNLLIKHLKGVSKLQVRGKSIFPLYHENTLPRDFDE